MIPGALAPAERESDQPQDKQHDGYNPQEVQRESQSGKEQDHQKSEQ